MMQEFLKARCLAKFKFKIFGLKRSGNHAIINWIAGHFGSGEVCFLNNLKGDYLKSFKKPSHRMDSDVYISDIEYLNDTRCYIESYEDLDPEFSDDSIIIIRDPFNLLASRIKLKSKKPNWGIDTSCVFREKLRKYFRLAITNKQKIINYNFWFSDIDYRKEVSSILGLEFSDKNLEQITNFGRGSSFSGIEFDGKAQLMNVLSRWKCIKEHQDFIELINDDEIVSLSNKIWGRIVD